MSFLQDFGGALASNIGSEMKQREDEARAIKLQDELERRRFARKNNMEASVALDAPVPFGVPVDRGGGRFEQATRVPVRALLNENTAEVVRPASWADGPSIPVPDPNALTPAQMETARQKELDRESRENAARIRGASRGGSGGGMTEFQRASIDERKANRERLEKQRGGSGGMTEKGWREGMDATLSSIQGAEAGKLKSIIRQYGGDNIMTANMDDDMLREAAFSVAETYWNERKPSNKAKAGDKQEDAGMTLAEALGYARKKAGGKLSPDVERKIRDAYGAN